MGSLSYKQELLMKSANMIQFKAWPYVSEPLQLINIVRKQQFMSNFKQLFPIQNVEDWF